MSLSLYVLADQFRELERIGTDEDLDATTIEAITTTLDGLKGDIELRATNVAYYIGNLEVFEKAAKDAAAKLAERAKRIKRRADAMREYIRMNMEKAGLTRIEGPQLTITRKANPPAVDVFNLETVPDSFRKEYPPIVRAIMDAARGSGTPAKVKKGAPEAITITLAALQLAIESQLPKPDPDKTKIAPVLKAAEAAHVTAILAAQKEEKEPPAWVNPVPGCQLTRGERLEIKA